MDREEGSVWFYLFDGNIERKLVVKISNYTHTKNSHTSKIVNLEAVNDGKQVFEVGFQGLLTLIVCLPVFEDRN